MSIIHDAVIVTGVDTTEQGMMERLVSKAAEWGLLATPIMDLPYGSFRSFAVLSDGATEGSPEAGQYSTRASEYAKALRLENVEFVHVVYGKDQPSGSKILETQAKRNLVAAVTQTSGNKIS